MQASNTNPTGNPTILEGSDHVAIYTDQAQSHGSDAKAGNDSDREFARFEDLARKLASAPKSQDK